MEVDGTTDKLYQIPYSFMARSMFVLTALNHRLAEFAKRMIFCKFFSND